MSFLIYGGPERPLEKNKYAGGGAGEARASVWEGHHIQPLGRGESAGGVRELCMLA